MRALALSLSCIAACGGPVVSGAPGTSAALTVAADAIANLEPPFEQYVEGALPDETGGPAVVALYFADRAVVRGASGRPLLGTMAPTTTAVAIGLVGDAGWWRVPAGAPTLDAPGQPTLSARLGFARTLAPGPQLLEVRAVDAAGRAGPPAQRELEIVAEPAVAGALVITLGWDRDADLDLRVVEPSGAELAAGRPTASGVVELDANGQCRVEGRNEERAVYATAPPSGRYLVRVDAFSLCRYSLANWHVEVAGDGAVVATADGIALESDTRGDHGVGSGRTALTVEQP